MNYLKRIGAFLFENLKIVVISLAIILPIRYYVIQPFFVIGASMEPNFETGDYLIIDELSYLFRQPQRGEVIVFHFPLDTRQYYIKRIIGLPGETLVIENGKIIIKNSDKAKGVTLDENYQLGGYTYGMTKITLKDNEYFVLGDNRPESSDSRRFGPVDKKFIVGRALVRAFPFSKITLFSY